MTVATQMREKEQSYHGVPVLEMHVGDPVPTPRAPTRYAVLVSPDLARYLLTFNHPQNRHRKERTIHKYANAMKAGLWPITPQSCVFSDTGVLMDGQNRLMAVTETGSAQWLVLDFGWPDEIITALDGGEKRTVSDAFTVRGVPSSVRCAAAIAVWHKYRTVRGGTDRRRSFNAFVNLDANASLAVFQEDPEGWSASVAWGSRMYDALDKGGSAAVWAAAHRIITDARGRDEADSYYHAIHDGTGAPRSATRTIGDFYRRRRATDTRSGDGREPLENVIRGFNAWRASKSVSLVTQSGFELSAVR